MQARRCIDPETARAGAQIARQTISRIENGHRMPDPWVQQALAQALGVTVGELLDEPPAFGQAWDVMAPPVSLAARDFAVRVDGLPEALRGRLLAVLGELLDVFSGDGLQAVSEPERELLALYGRLPEAERLALLAQVQERIAQRATGSLAADAAQSG